jgi:bifunctional NMN adenylyltransferase/nudix hydrolase
MMHKYPTSFQATDIVVIDKTLERVLLGKKPKQPFFRFLGGFVDPKDTSLEEAAQRELAEEGGKDMTCFNFRYWFSFRVEDPRYFDSEDKIMSAVFLANYVGGTPKAGDDIGEVEWFDFKKLKNYKNLVMPEHHIIARRLNLFDKNLNLL